MAHRLKIAAVYDGWCFALDFKPMSLFLKYATFKQSEITLPVGLVLAVLTGTSHLVVIMFLFTYSLILARS